MAASAIEAYGNLECAVNVPYGNNWLSTSSHFCNLGDTFRARVFCGQAINLNGRPGPIRTGDPLLRRQMLYPTELRARAFILSATREIPAPNYAIAPREAEAYTCFWNRRRNGQMSFSRQNCLPISTEQIYLCWPFLVNFSLSIFALSILALVDFRSGRSLL
jgi:hypothetical protein